MEYRACVEELLFSSQVQHMKSIRTTPACPAMSTVSLCPMWPGTWRTGGGPTRAPLRGRGCSTTCISTTPAPCPPTGSALPIRRRRGECGRAVRRPDRREKNCILAHMWPLSRRAPRSREAAAVCLADKLCATAEIMQIWRNLGLRRAVLSGA